MILDHIDGLALSDADADKHRDGLMALARLAEGLAWLHREVARIEADARVVADKDDVRVDVIGDVIADTPLGVLSCSFMWYAVSACNYAQLVGWLVTGDKSAAKKYVDKVMPRLLKYRNKVAAHFALADPRQDNEAELAASVMTQIVYAHGRLCAAALSPILMQGGQEIRAAKGVSWSLTLAHERLVHRYWPDGLRKSHQAIWVPAKTTLKFNVDWEDLAG